MTLVERIIEQIRKLFSAPDLPHFIDDDIMPHPGKATLDV